MSKKTIEERMKWLVPEDRHVADWFRTYADSREWIREYVYQEEQYVGLIDSSNTAFCEKFLQNWASKGSITSEDKHRINLLRSAWASHQNSKSKVTLSLSSEAQKSLSFLSKTYGIAKTEVVKELLINAHELFKIQKSLKKTLKSKPNKNEFNKNFDFLSEVLNYNSLKEEVKSLKEENRLLILELKKSVPGDTETL
ncbi:hypothetical protein HGG78_16120 [Vibrio aestuarianus]|uniref:hypothetical protein n=1 Tax=Vibrio aestuarianus TaxID=28171 RepID=UPI001559E435|nr:hypothetical protein [Vibrio aestuarianus]NGZ15264.1 hypothetical protein [Vibrio aestuarianus]NKZ51412.1 hypothetical protein [Vibrio aestuarianus]